jgi:outer membrane receptor protein involved in Fe transport
MRIGIVVAASLLFTVAPAAAQSITTGAIKGTVTDKVTGEPLPGITVTAGSQTVITEADGTYAITQLVPGTYDVVFDLGDTKVIRSHIEVLVDSELRLDQKIKLGETIEIPGTPPPINFPSTAHEYHIGRPELEGVPHPSATFESAIGGIGGSQNDGVGPAFSGSTSLENRYIVDGIDITGLTFGNIGTPVLNEFIQDLEVVTGGYNAEYGRATGGIVNIITRNGTDTFRGSIFGTITPGFLTASAQVAPINASSIDVITNKAYSGNIGFEMGGPIVKGKAWFYVGAAPQVDHTDYVRITKRETDCRKTLPNGQLSTCDPANADASPDIDPKTGFYLTDELDRETRPGSSTSTSIIAKIAAAPFADHQAQVSLIAQPSSSETPGLYGLPSSGRRTSGPTTDTAARWTAKFGDGATEVEALIAWHRSTLDSGSIDPSLDSQPLQLLQDGDLGTWSALGGESAATIAGCKDGAASDPYKTITNCPMTTQQYAIGGPGGMNHDIEERRAARLSAIQRGKLAGSHEIKAGLDFEDDVKQIARLYSGGAIITNDINGGVVQISRYAELAAPGDTDPRFDQTCSTAVMNPNGMGTTMKQFQCAFLGGTVGAPHTEIGGQTVNWAAYLRDSWQPMKNLTLNAGLRYEEQRLRYAQNLRNTTDPLTGEHIGDTAMTLKGNFAPRLGITYDPTNEGRAKLYAHWGRFYESIPMDINDRSFGGEVSDRRTYVGMGVCGPPDPKLGGQDGTGCLTKPNPTQEELIGSSGVLVAPGTQAEYMDEVLAGAEVAVIPDIVLGVTLQHRRLGRVVEDMSTDGANTYIIGNPSEFSAAEEQKLQQQIAATTDKAEQARLAHELDLFKGIRTFDKPVRDYDALEVSVSRKFAPGLYLQSSYTYSRTNGNYPGSVSYDNGQIDPNISSQYDLVELLANRRGALPQDRPHSIKLDGYYTYNLSPKQAITIGTRIRAISGIPENALAGHYLYGPNESFLLPRGQLGRTDFEHGIDIHVAYKRRMTAKTTAELYVDVFNLYNHQGTFDVDNTYAPYYKLSSAGSAGEQQNANPVSGGTYEDLIWVKEIDQNGIESAKPIGRNPNFHNTVSRYAPASAQIGFRVSF